MKKIKKTVSGINVAANIKAGGLPCLNHSRRLALAVKSGIKAGQGILADNHNRRAR